MNICFNINFLQEIKSGDLLTYLALLLAYIAYSWSVNRDLNSWKSLFVSLKADLDYAGQWLASEYSKETYQDKTSFSPRKIILPLSFESLPEIIRRGVAEFNWISTEFLNNLSLFNERVAAFNLMLDQVRKVVSSNPVLTEKLNDQLSELGLYNEEKPEFNEFKEKIRELKKDNEVFYLAENIRRLNRVIHADLIGNKNSKDKLHYLYTKIREELEIILENFDKKRPFFIRFKWLMVLLSIPIFLLIEALL